MPGFYGLINKHGYQYSFDEKFDVINNNIFTNKWSKKDYFEFTISDEHASLGIVSLKENRTLIKPPSGISSEIYFEGYLYEIKGVTEIPKDHNDLRGLLNRLYLKYGDNLYERLYGSFSIIIITPESISLVTDQTCSRPIYLFHSDKYFAWCPELLPLLKAFKSELSLNIRNIGQILCSEFSFIDDTIVNEIVFLRPGEILKYRKGGITRNQYFRFSYRENTEWSRSTNSNRLAKTLNDRIRKVISAQWTIARSPAIMLSGGLDSRYILSAIADAVGDTSKLKLVTWTINNPGRYSDLDVAKKIAKKLGSKHIALNRDENCIINELDKTFSLIGCEVDSFFHVNERLLIEELRERHGIESLFRGEQSFGWGEFRRNIKYALNQIIVSYPEDNPFMRKIFHPDVYKEIIRSWHLRLEDILKEYHQKSVNDFKDSLYFNWRLARYLNTLSYFKLSYMEQYNPLLDLDVININSNTPSRLRVDKKIFRRAYKEKECILKDIPYATTSSLEDWGRIVLSNKEIFNYLIEKHAIEDILFQNSKDTVTSYFHMLKLKREGTGRNIFTYLNSNPFIKHNTIFKAFNKIRHLYVKPPKETDQTKFLFRAAIVKDFLQKYFY